jgi:chromosome partitioning protein
MTKIISFFSTKGGSTKSASCVFTAYSLAESGHSVLVLDMCPNGDISNNFGYSRFDFQGKTSYDWLVGQASEEEVIVKTRDDMEVYFIPSGSNLSNLDLWLKQNEKMQPDLYLKKKLKPLLGMVDYILIDTHPDKDCVQTRLSLFASDTVIVPVTPDGNAIQGSQNAVEFLLGMIEYEFIEEFKIMPTSVRTNDFGADEGIMNQLREFFGEDRFLQTMVRYCSMIPKWTRQEKTYDFLKTHTTGSKLIQDYKNALAEMGLTEGVATNGKR